MDSGTLYAIQSFIRDIGFPVFVAVYVLVRVEHTVKANTKALQDVAAIVRTMRDGPAWPARQERDE